MQALSQLSYTPFLKPDAPALCCIKLLNSGNAIFYNKLSVRMTFAGSLLRIRFYN